jgi:cytochrome c553
MNKLLHSSTAGILLLTVTVAGGCTWSFGGSDRDVPEMHRKLSRTVDIQTGVVQGDLERAQKAASWLLSREETMTLPAAAKVHEEEMLGHASEITLALNLETVAAQAGQLAAACGSCHQATNAGPRFVLGSDSPNGGSQEAQMIRHLWAADRMWEGLVGPSEEAWMAGAQAMAETQPALARAFRASTSPGESQDFLEEVNLLAKEAIVAQGQQDRADVYGRMLTTCHQCHSPMRILVKVK